LGEIILPSFSLFGCSTPDEFYAALSIGNVKDGFMNRFLIANADPKEKSNDLEAGVPVPRRVIDDLLHIATFGDHKLAPVAGDNKPDSMWNKPRRVGWDDDFAKEAFYRFRDEIESVQDATTIAPELLARVPEQTL
jgi:hypothetical protein